MSPRVSKPSRRAEFSREDLLRRPVGERAIRKKAKRAYKEGMRKLRTPGAYEKMLRKRTGQIISIILTDMGIFDRKERARIHELLSELGGRKRVKKKRPKKEIVQELDALLGKSKEFDSRALELVEAIPIYARKFYEKDTEVLLDNMLRVVRKFKEKKRREQEKA